MEKVLYEELFPDEFAERIKKMPVAFLPLGTLEWHGPHMPLGADGIQFKGIIYRACRENGRGGPSNAICRAGSRVR